MMCSRLPRDLKIGAVPHGFPSSFRDWTAEETNHPREVVEAALAHVIQNNVEAAYARSDLFERLVAADGRLGRLSQTARPERGSRGAGAFARLSGRLPTTRGAPPERHLRTRRRRPGPGSAYGVDGTIGTARRRLGRRQSARLTVDARATQRLPMTRSRSASNPATGSGMFSVNDLSTHRAGLRTLPEQLRLRRVGRGVLDAPDSKQIAASIGETAGEIDDLHLGKGPGQLVSGARSMQQRSDASFEPALLEGVQEFSLHPSGSHGIGGENDDEPIAALQRSADLVVPLLGTLDVGVAIP